MRRIFRLDGHALLNYNDYKKVFNPLSVHRQLDTFLPFAEVHLVPLPLVYKAQDSSFAAAKYWNKSFWYQLLEEIQTIPPNTTVDSNFLFKYMGEWYDERRANEYMSNGKEKTNNKALLAQEADILQIKEKLFFGRKALKATDKNDAECLCLLAICELSDEDIRNHKLTCETKPKTAQQDNKILDFPEGDVLPLEARSFPYKFRYFTGNTLPHKKLIRTVKIKATGNRDDNIPTVIQLFDNQKRVQTVTLKVGEYRFVNVCAGKVIKFLPAVSVNEKICIYRKNYYENSYFVEPRGEDGWELETKGRDISVISAGNTGSCYAYIFDNKVYFSTCFIDSLDYYNKEYLKMCIQNVNSLSKAVEVELVGNNGFAILLQDGQVITCNTNFSNQKKVLFLSSNGRAGYLHYDETIISEACADNKKQYIYIRRIDTGEVLPDINGEVY